MPGSETAALLANKDWEKTPLGPQASWPASLRIAVGICLSSRFPMFVWWGKELINIYNDAYIPVLGKRHPNAFGEPARDYWSEIWQVVGPQAEAVMERGEATWNQNVLLVMERNGYTEDTYFTWSYSPILDEAGAVRGLFCACTEETPWVLAERQRDLLIERLDNERSRLASAFEQSPAFLAILRGAEHVFESVNERFYQLVGQRDLIGRSVREAFPELAGQGYAEMLDSVFSSGQLFGGTDLRLMLRRQPGQPPEELYIDLSCQPVRGTEGTVIGVLAHGVDVTARKRVERRHQFLLALEEAIRALDDIDEIALVCARLLCEHLGANRVAYAFVEDDQDTYVLTGDHNRDVPSIVGRYRFSDLGQEWVRLMRSAQPYVTTDIEAHGLDAEALLPYRKAHVRGIVCVPLHRSGRLVAAIAVHQATPRRWIPSEIELVRQVGSRCFEAIERTRVARELRMSEARFRAAVTAISSILWTNDPKGKMVGEQPSWSAFTGQTYDEYQGYGWTNALHPDDVARTVEAWERCVVSRSPFVFEHRLKRADGQYRICSIRAVPVLDALHRVREWVGVHTDVTAQREFEQSLQESETRFRHMSDNAPVMIWVTGPTGMCEYLNAQWYTFTGQTQDQALGHGWLLPVHDDDRERVGEQFTTANQNGEPFRVEYRLRRRDGQYRWCVDSAWPRRTVSGEFLGYIGSVVDIDDRKHMEDVLTAEKRALELIATNSPVNEVLNAIARGVEAQSADGMMCSILVSDSSGKRLSVGAAPKLPKQFADSLDDIAIAPESNTCGTAAYERQSVVVSDIKGHPLWREHGPVALAHGIRACTATPIVASDGRVLGTVAIYYRAPHEPNSHDMELMRSATHLAGIILEKQRVDRRLRESFEAEQHARAEAERASRTKDEFLASLSHELRTPLNAILGWSQVMRIKRDLSAELVKGLDVIERNARAQARIIEDLLDMSAIISGKVRLEVQRVRLAQVVQSAVDTVRPTADSKQVSLSCVVDSADDLTIRGDPNRLQQVLWNLVTNAVKFTPPGGHVYVRLAADQNYAEVSVRDTGEGISAEFLPFVFDRFRQADASSTRRHGGLGLGLSIVKQLVELHGGNVSVQSEGSGLGATFRFVLPLATSKFDIGKQPITQQHAALSARASTHHEEHPIAGLSILVVDDEVDARELVRRLLENRAARVTTASCAEEAVQLLTSRQFDVLISDLGMPDEDGHSLIRRVRGMGRERNGEVPAVALTAYARPEDRQRALGAGFQMHVTKPVDPAKLIATVASLAKRNEQHSSEAG